MEFSKRLKELRKQKKLSQTALGNIIGVTLKQVQRYESGENEPTLSILAALANCFNVPVDYLTGNGLYGQLEEHPELRGIISEPLQQILGSKYLEQFDLKSLDELDNVTFAQIASALISKVEMNEDDNAINIFYKI